MPKKKKDKKGKDKGKNEEEKEAEKKPFEAPDSTFKEIQLKRELDELDMELCSLKKQVKDLRGENEWLQQEAEKTKLESQDYQTFMSRKAQKRQDLVVSLNDYHKQELEKIEKEREELLKDYDEKRTELRHRLLDRQHELAKVEAELEKLQPFKEQQEKQEQEIRSLERQLEEARFNHENQVRKMKTQFLQEKKAFDVEMGNQVRAMVERATRQASLCLQEQTKNICTENQQLRMELKQLIDTTNDLQLQKKRLAGQYYTLLREHQLNQDFLRLKGGPFSKARKNKGLLPSIPLSSSSPLRGQFL